MWGLIFESMNKSTWEKLTSLYQGSFRTLNTVEVADIAASFTIVENLDTLVLAVHFEVVKE